ncbi:MAG: universal stress protein [Elusimicrobia bacterium]|nr:universal stress protein [Elusimicrobiota bacterium]
MRFPPKRILAAYDFTEPSEAAWRVAKDWARQFGSELHAIYVEEPPPVSDWGLPILPFDRREKRRVMVHLRKRLGPKTVVHVGEGEAVSAILRQGRRRRSDLLVLGTHGRKGLDRLVQGSVAEEVIRSSPVPVLVTRTPELNLKRILAPINFTDYGDRGLRFAAEVAAAFERPLTALHVRGAKESRAQPELLLDRLIESLPERVRPLVQGKSCVGSVIETMLREASKPGTLMVLAIHEKPLPQRWVHGMTVLQLLRRGAEALLAVPPASAGRAADLSAGELAFGIPPV